MQVIDITGPIYTGMWNYSEPLGSILGTFKASNMAFEFGGEKYSLEIFEGFKAQTGTYLESPGQYLKERYYVSDVSADKLFMMQAYVLFIPFETLGEKDGKRFVSLDNLKDAQKYDIPEGAAILVGTGYGKNWQDKDFFMKSWFFKKEAMEYIISKKPFILGTDSAEWENPKNPEGIFKIFYPANILILASCINLELINRFKVYLTVMPFNVTGSFICPVRAVVTF